LGRIIIYISEGTAIRIFMSLSEIFFKMFLQQNLLNSVLEINTEPIQTINIDMKDVIKLQSNQR
jgi:hypothetical protein